MTMKHSTHDQNNPFILDPVTRTWTNAAVQKHNLIQGDHNSEVFTFRLPRLIEGHDMSVCDAVQVHYINIDSVTRAQSCGVYEVEDLQVNPEDSETITCSWLISHNATKYVGILHFLLRFTCSREDGTLDYVWQSAIDSSVVVAKGINAGEILTDTYPDILAQWRQDLIESGIGAVVSSVEPAEDDIPKVFFGGPLQQTKDEAVVSFRYISKTEDISGYAEIKAQGNSSMSYPKKNQTVKLFKDAECTEKLKVDFKGWGKQNKFCFKANWIDLTHARNVVSARLWADVVKSRANYAELPELLRTTPNQGAMDGFPIKVYANGVYQGRYTLNIPKDKWAFNMDDDLDNHCVLCGENYASGCFRAAANINESDWTDEIHDTVPTSIKTRWNEVISFVMNSTDEDFKANLGNFFYVDSLIDYYLFGLASCGLDAFGKNQLYMTYDGQKWFASKYDMDSTWGLYWNGSRFVATNYGRNQYEDYVNSTGNLLYVRLEKIFYEELQARWAELKNDALSIENIINRFERFTDITPAELIKEDYASTTGEGKFVGIPSQTTNNIQQIRAYALARQAWTDEYVAGLTPGEEVPCTGITLSASELTFNGAGTQTLVATVEPENTSDSVVWSVDDNTIATVAGGVVTAKANGSCVIIATCGKQTATCAVSVSGIVKAVPCTNITLDKTTLAFDGAGTQTLVANVTPADTTDPVIWKSDDEYVATVDGGVVTAVSNGTTNITAICGNYSATCTVEVNGVAVTFETARWEEGYYNEQGEIGYSGNFHHTELIPIPDDFSEYGYLVGLSDGSGIAHTQGAFANAVVRVVYFDSDLNYLGNNRNFSLGSQSTNAELYVEVLPSVANAVYYAVSANTQNKNDLAIQKYHRYHIAESIEDSYWLIPGCANGVQYVVNLPAGYYRSSYFDLEKVSGTVSCATENAQTFLRISYFDENFNFLGWDKGLGFKVEDANNNAAAVTILSNVANAKYFNISATADKSGISIS